MFKGSIPALITPFKNGEVDYASLEKLVEWQISEGSSGLVAVGTTGESPTLSHDEHKSVIKSIVSTANKRIPIIAGAGSNNTSESIELMEFAESVGADAALVVTPYYNKPNQSGLFRHYKILHDSSKVLIYNSLIEKNTNGIASKDNSISVVVHSNLIDNKLDLSSYKKNWRYGGSGNIEVNDSLIQGSENKLNSDKKGTISISSSEIIGKLKKTKNVTIN